MTKWPEEANEMLRQMWRDGAVGSKIANALTERFYESTYRRFSRNAVLARVRQMDLPRRVETPLARRTPGVSARREKRISTFLARNAEETESIIRQAPPKPQAVTLARSMRLPPCAGPSLFAPAQRDDGRKYIHELREVDCRYPYDDAEAPGGFILCAAPKSCGSYCDGHARICYGGQPIRTAVKPAQ